MTSFYIRMFLVLVSLFTAGSAFAAAQVELQPGAVYAVEDKNLGPLFIKCLDKEPAQQATVKAFCTNSKELVITLDSLYTEDMVTLVLTNNFSCQNAADKFKSAVKDFSGIKTVMFCDGKDLHKIKLNAVGEITPTIIKTANNFECNNALD